MSIKCSKTYLYKHLFNSKIFPGVIPPNLDPLKGGGEKVQRGEEGEMRGGRLCHGCRGRDRRPKVFIERICSHKFYEVQRKVPITSVGF